jgi:hypothetical protein
MALTWSPELRETPRPGDGGVKHASRPLHARKYDGLREAELGRDLARREALDLEQRERHPLTVRHLRQRDLYELELSLSLERFGGSVPAHVRVQSPVLEPVHRLDRLRWPPPPPAPPVRHDPSGRGQKERALSVWIDVAEAPYAHDHHLLDDVLQVPSKDPQAPSGAPHGVEVAMEDLLHPSRTRRGVCGRCRRSQGGPIWDDGGQVQLDGT